MLACITKPPEFTTPALLPRVEISGMVSLLIVMLLMLQIVSQDGIRELVLAIQLLLVHLQVQLLLLVPVLLVRK